MSLWLPLSACCSPGCEPCLRNKKATTEKAIPRILMLGFAKPSGVPTRLMILRDTLYFEEFPCWDAMMAPDVMIAALP